jgi:hypothetical protein
MHFFGMYWSGPLEQGFDKGVIGALSITRAIRREMATGRYTRLSSQRTFTSVTAFQRLSFYLKVIFASLSTAAKPIYISKKAEST